jgi:hypothetical protein
MRPLKTRPRVEEIPPDVPGLDPSAVRRNYREARLRRRHRIERTMRSRHASVRFWAVLVILLSFSAYIAVTVWNQIQQLFGL